MTWETLTQVQIPLHFAAQKNAKHLSSLIGISILVSIPLSYLTLLSFRQFMHLVKPLTY